VYVGNLAAYRFDFALVRAAARALPRVTFVLVGPVGLGDPESPGGSAAALASEPNVRLLGAFPQAELPGILAHSDVALLPLLENPHTLSCMPLKLWEYLAAGLPVVSRDLPNLRGLADERAIRLYRSEAELVTAIARALDDARTGRESRLELARAHAWPARIDEIRLRLGAAIP
jgi:glycosyltransferase involved in cell wall biosynthesis